MGNSDAIDPVMNRDKYGESFDWLNDYRRDDHKWFRYATFA
jgi:hypothetical protein